MNQTAQQAAEQHVNHIYGDYEACEARGMDEGRQEHIETFVAGWEAGQPEWIPATERLPENQQPVLFRVISRDAWYNGKILGGKYTGHDFSTPGMGYEASHWCPIPDSLLNFKP